MNKSIYAIPAFTAALLASQDAFAQTSSQTYIFEGTSFWVALFSGLLLALAFQVVLTGLSFAMGMSMTPNLKKALAKAKAKPSKHDDRHFNDDHHDDDDEMISTRMKIVNGMGVWSMITTSIALFTATWIAVRFNYISLDSTGLLVGLVVWALFTVFVSYLEIKSVRSLTGGLTSIVSSGLQVGANSLKSVFSRSEAHHAENVGRHAVRGIYEELVYLDRKKNLGRNIEKYISQITPDVPSYKKMQRDLEHLIRDIKVEEKYDLTHDEMIRELSVKLEKDHKHMNKKNADMVYSAAGRAFDNAERQGTKAGKVAAVTDAMAPMKDSDAKKYREKLAKALKNSGREEVDPEALKKDIEKIVSSPKTAKDVVRARLALFDRDTVKAVLAEHKKLDKKKTDKIVETVLKAVSGVSTKYGSGKTAAASKKKAASVKSKEMPARVKMRIANYCDSLGREEVSYERIKHDIEEIMHDPTCAPQVLKAHLAEMDRNTLVAVLESNRHISHDRAEELADSIIAMRDSVSKNIDKAKDGALKKYEDLSRRAAIHAEHTREVVMAAGWWMFLTAIISGVAAAAGGLIGTVPPLTL